MRYSSHANRERRIHRLLKQLDLDALKVKLMRRENWSRHRADQVEIQYKRYLWLIYKYPDKSLVPSKDVDAFWHSHILDTRKYANDCERIFGYFVHHFPYFGLRGSSDELALRRAAEETRELYVAEFHNVATAADSMCHLTETYEFCGHDCNNKSLIAIHDGAVTVGV